jgi:hypothetical protein
MLRMCLSKPSVSEVSRSIIDFVKEAESRSGWSGSRVLEKEKTWRRGDLQISSATTAEAEKSERHRFDIW